MRIRIECTARVDHGSDLTLGVIREIQLMTELIADDKEKPWEGRHTRGSCRGAIGQGDCLTTPRSKGLKIPSGIVHLNRVVLVDELPATYVSRGIGRRCKPICRRSILLVPA